MSYISPELQTKFEELPIELKNAILSRDVRLESMNDLISVLEQIVNSDNVSETD